MSNSIIRAGFETQLKTWADAKGIPVAWQNVSFTKPANGGMYVEPILIPGPTLNKELSAKRKTYLGIFQVNCWAPSGNGMGPVEQLAQELVNMFAVNSKKLGAVVIDKTPEQDRPMDDSGWIIVPVTIQYRMETY